MPFVRKFWKPKESIPTTSTLPAAASPTHPSAPSPAPEEPLTDAVGRHLDQPSALFTSPPFVNDTDIQLQPTKLAAAFAALSEAYRVCSDTILDSDRFASTECGQEFERCIDDRIYGLSFDLQTLEARVTGYAAPVDGPVMSGAWLSRSTEEVQKSLMHWLTLGSSRTEGNCGAGVDSVVTASRG